MAEGPILHGDGRSGRLEVLGGGEKATRGKDTLDPGAVWVKDICVHSLDVPVGGEAGNDGGAL